MYSIALQEIIATPKRRCYQNTVTGMRDFVGAANDLDSIWRTMFTCGQMKTAIRIQCDASTPSPMVDNVSDIYTAPETPPTSSPTSLNIKSQNTGFNKPTIATVPKAFGFTNNVLTPELAANRLTSSPRQSTSNNDAARRAISHQRTPMENNPETRTIKPSAPTSKTMTSPFLRPQRQRLSNQPHPEREKLLKLSRLWSRSIKLPKHLRRTLDHP